MEKCTIIIPVHYDNLGERHNFTPLIKILTAMNEIDGDIAEYFVTLRKKSNKVVIKKMDVVDLVEDFEVKYTVEDVYENLKNNVMKSKQLCWEIKKNMLFEFCNKNQRIMRLRECYGGYRLGVWLQNNKRTIFSRKNIRYKKLSKNIYVKESVEEHFLKQKKNKNKPNLTWKQWKELLFEYCDKYKTTPSEREKYNNLSLGNWFQNQKSRIKSRDDKICKILMANLHVKENIENYLDPQRVWEKKKKLLFEYCNINKCPPKGEIKYKNENISSWLNNQKRKIASTKSDTYQKLMINKYVKKNLDVFLETRNKRKKRLAENQGKKLLFEYCNIYHKMPAQKYRYKGYLIGSWFQYRRKKIKNRECNL